MADVDGGGTDPPLDDEELDERLEMDMGEPDADVATTEPETGGTPDDVGRGAD
jgi:hypothetical protein